MSDSEDDNNDHDIDNPALEVDATDIEVETYDDDIDVEEIGVEAEVDETVDDDAQTTAQETNADREFTYEHKRAPEIQECEEHIVIADDKKRTSNIMSHAEFTELISLSTERISREGMRACMLDSVPEGATTAREIALAEVYSRRCPYKLIRHVGFDIGADGLIKKYVEIWSPNDMTFPRAY